MRVVWTPDTRYSLKYEFNHPIQFEMARNLYVEGMSSDEFEEVLDKNGVDYCYYLTFHDDDLIRNH